MNYHMARITYTTLGLATLLFSTASAQRVQDVPRYMNSGVMHAEASTDDTRPALGGTDRDGGDVIWSEDFSNGLDGSNESNAPWTLDGSNGEIWTWTTAGPNGAYAGSNPNAARIQSATVSNGFMVFNGDSVNCTWSGGVPTALPSSEFVAYDGSLVSPIIDLTGHPAVILQYQQAIRYCCQDAPHFVEVSTDGGNTWPTRLAASGSAVGGATTSATETITLNLTQAIAADPANVLIRFHHDAESGTSHYFWQIDDVKIIEAYDYDLQIQSAGSTTWDPETAFSYDSLYYSITPYSQLRPIGLNMKVVNNGALEQTDVTANFKVVRGADVILDQDQLVSLTPGVTSTVFVDPGFTPPAVQGTYTLTTLVTGETDQTPTNNSLAGGTFKVDPYVYSRDGGRATSGYFDGAQGVFDMMNAFYVANNDVLYGIVVAFNTGSEVGTIIRGSLRADDRTTVLATTPEYELAQTDLNNANQTKVKVLVFDDPIPLDAGVDYFAAVEVFGSARMSVNGTAENFTSFIYYDSPNDETAGPVFFYVTDTPIIRMMLGATADIEDGTAMELTKLGQNMPNPAKGTTSILYQLATTETVSFEIHDVSGKLVYAQNEGRKPGGQHRIDLNTLNLNEGLYTYSIVAGDLRLTKRMTVIH